MDRCGFCNQPKHSGEGCWKAAERRKLQDGRSKSRTKSARRKPMTRKQISAFIDDLLGPEAPIPPATPEDRRERERERQRQYMNECRDCGDPCSRRSTRCSKCAGIKRRGDPDGHGYGRYNQGCRCDICVDAMHRYSKTATCVDCGKPCQPARISTRRPGWQPPDQTRCMQCYQASRRRDPALLICDCGNSKSANSKMCRICRWPEWGSGELTGWERRRRDAPGIGPTAMKRLIERWRKQGQTCAYCLSAPVEVIDHVLPIALGGTSFEGNLAPACWICNSRKGAQLLSAWRHDSTIRPIRSPAQPKRPKPAPKPKVKPESIEVMIQCWICSGWATLPAKCCSDQCKVEANARQARDRYRAKVGIPVDVSEPTRRLKVLVPQ